MSPTRKIWLPKGVVFHNISQQQAGSGNVGAKFYSKGKWTPDTDIYEGDDGILIIMDIAGVKKEEIQIVLEGQVLSIYPECAGGQRCRRNISTASRLILAISNGHSGFLLR